MDGDGPETENHFGLIQNDWQTPKPSFFAFQQMSAHLAGGLAQGLVNRGDGGTRIGSIATARGGCRLGRRADQFRD